VDGCRCRGYAEEKEDGLCIAIMPELEWIIRKTITKETEQNVFSSSCGFQSVF